ncbi:MAG: hypothetical protein QXP42_03040 [Candidatus Micrarchaeia archaeon]
MQKGRMPEAELIRKEILLRDMLLTKDVKLTRRSLIRWLAMSIGLISPGESRRTMIALLDALLYFQFTKKANPDVSSIIKYMQEKDGSVKEKTVRYHLLQLQRAGILEREKGHYRFSSSPFSEQGDLEAALEHNYRSSFETAFSKVREAIKLLKRMYKY